MHIQLGVIEYYNMTWQDINITPTNMQKIGLKLGIHNI